MCPRRPNRRRRGLRQDESGVSEVVGYIISFGIISVILLISMLSFASLQEEVSERIVEQRAVSAANRVSSVVVKAGLFAETYGEGTEFDRTVELPDQFEGLDYRVLTVPAGTPTADDPDRVEVWVPALDLTITSAVFAAGAPPDFSLCPTEVGGGTLVVRFGDNGGTQCIFLLEASS